jgi:hypothetical protein
MGTIKIEVEYSENLGKYVIIVRRLKKNSLPKQLLMMILDSFTIEKGEPGKFLVGSGSIYSDMPKLVRQMVHLKNKLESR